MPRSHTKRLEELIKRKGLLRPRDLEKYGIPKDYLFRFYMRGLLKRTGRGIYTAADAEPVENQTLAEACMRLPQGVACLLTALQFHGLTTQTPYEIWLAINRRSRKPSIDLPVRIVLFSGDSLTKGIETHKIENVRVRVYCPAKTVADCFKYRNKIGQDVALEALRDCWKQKKATMDELWKYAKICRVANVMQPYMESLT